MALNYMLGRMDVPRFPLAAIPVCGYVDARVLGASSAESHTVPAGATKVVFSSTGDFYANFTTTAAVPSGDVTDGSASVLNPLARNIYGVTAISLISPAACVVTMEFYK
ncbi:MAG: hypothetical protein WBK67_03160 [Minisyncoccales bacterium]